MATKINDTSDSREINGDCNTTKPQKSTSKPEQSKMSRSSSHKFVKGNTSEHKNSEAGWARNANSETGGDNLPGYAQPTVAFQLRISLCHSTADMMNDQHLPVCQRYRSSSPTSLSTFIKEQRSRSAETKRNQMDKMIELSQPVSRRSKFTSSIPHSNSNHTTASDGSTPHAAGHLSKIQTKSIKKKSSFDDSNIGPKNRITKNIANRSLIKSNTLKKKTSSLDVLADSGEQRHQSTIIKSPTKASTPTSTNRGSHSRDSSKNPKEVISIESKKVKTQDKIKAKPKSNDLLPKDLSKDITKKTIKENEKIETEKRKKNDDDDKKQSEEYKAKLAEKRKQARDKAEMEHEKQRLAEEEQSRIKVEEEKKQEEEELKFVEESRKAEEERLQKYINEEDERKKKEAEKLEQEYQAKKNQERIAREEAEKNEHERQIKIKKDEEEKLERKKRLETIMKRVKTDESNEKKSEELDTKNFELDKNEDCQEHENLGVHEEDKTEEIHNENHNQDEIGGKNEKLSFNETVKNDISIMPTDRPETEDPKTKPENIQMLDEEKMTEQNDETLVINDKDSEEQSNLEQKIDEAKGNN